ncbi:MAG: DUF438 domain-containing protein [Candidatus Kapabacteria bacterium]|jgi:DUF438 domain-containing protein|nr:DUF438 domain-containing protein [Candidatus Kapabacteria bacterium]
MSELINNSDKRKELLKHMILQLHDGAAPEEINQRLVELLKKIPYGEVVEVEQELIKDGLPESEILKLCDVHTQALDGQIDISLQKLVPPGHPADTFKKENEELSKVVAELEKLYDSLKDVKDDELDQYVIKLRTQFNNLSDVEKHYVKLENLLFPYLEAAGITGPPVVMWGKHDETRAMLKGAIEVLKSPDISSKEELEGVIELVLRPASTSVDDMTMKEDEILLPMSKDKLTDIEWYEIYKQTPEVGYCLYDPPLEWKPADIEETEEEIGDGSEIKFPSGSFTNEELLAMLNTLPVDMTFVDKNDKVKYFSQGSHRVFHRTRAILKRDVRMCHPPSSVDVVDRIIEDFRSGRQDKAQFWIQMGGKFILIEYYAMRNDKGEYLGTLEVSQDASETRALEGEQRILDYGEKK